MGQTIGTCHKVGCLFKLSLQHVSSSTSLAASSPSNTYPFKSLAFLPLSCFILSSQNFFSSSGQLRPINYKAFDYMPCQLSKHVNLSFKNNDSITFVAFDLIYPNI